MLSRSRPCLLVVVVAFAGSAATARRLAFYGAAGGCLACLPSVQCAVCLICAQGPKVVNRFNMIRRDVSFTVSYTL